MAESGSFTQKVEQLRSKIESQFLMEYKDNASNLSTQMVEYFDYHQVMWNKCDYYF